MKSLIVGGSSTVGQALLPALSRLGPVSTAGRTGCDISLDLSSLIDPLAIPQGVDVLIHTAAQFGGPTDEALLATENVNALGTLRLLQVAREAGVKHFIFISSIFSQLDEAKSQYGIYAISKRHAEDLARYYAKSHDLALTILRPSQLYGNGEEFRKHHPFLYSMIDQAAQGKPITLFGSNDARRNFLHIDDLAEVIVRVAEQGIVGTFGVMHPEDVTYSRIARAAFAAFQHEGAIEFVPSKPDIPDNVFPLDNSLYAAIGFSPRTSIESGVAAIARYRAIGQ